MALDDTHPEIRALQIRLYRKMTPARKAELIEEAWFTTRELALAGIRSRLPGCSEAEAHDELARLLLGKPLADRVAASRRDRRP